MVLFAAVHMSLPVSCAEDYLAKAAECERQAAATKDTVVREQFTRLAQQGRDMAKRAGEQDLKRSESPVFGNYIIATFLKAGLWI
jgi:hypothetical protein